MNEFSADNAITSSIQSTLRGTSEESCLGNHCGMDVLRFVAHASTNNNASDIPIPSQANRKRKICWTPTTFSANSGPELCSRNLVIFPFARCYPSMHCH